MAANQVAVANQAAQGPVAALKSALDNVNVKQKFAEVLGPQAKPFMASIVNVVTGSNQLKQCDPNSIIGAAFVAATLNLPVDSSLGFAALVPFNVSKKGEDGRYYKVMSCQLQIMTRGFTQLAIRSGLYTEMNTTEIYEDELLEYDPIRGTCKFSSTHDQRMNGEFDKIIGYYAWFRLNTGFMKEVYMSKEQVLAHAKRYSQSYGYDLKYGKKTSRWSTDFDAMGRKTVLKNLLTKWGPLSIEIQNAVVNDQMVYTGLDEGSYLDNPTSDGAALETEVPDIFGDASEDQAAPTAEVPAQPAPAEKKAPAKKTAKKEQNVQSAQDVPDDVDFFASLGMGSGDDDDEVPFR